MKRVSLDIEGLKIRMLSVLDFCNNKRKCISMGKGDKFAVMIYGTIKATTEYLGKTAKDPVDEYNLKLGIMGLFGGIRIQRGFEYADSDCDTRFFVVCQGRDFPKKSCVPWEMTEEEELGKTFLSIHLLGVFG